MKHQSKFSGYLLVAGTGGSAISISSHAASVKNEVLLVKPTLFNLFDDVIEVIGVLVFQSNYERV